MSGPIFTLSTNGGGYNILHSFKSFAGDAQSPLGALLEGKDGVLYGTTYSGGSNGVGAIFKLAQAGTNYSVWRSFLSERRGRAEPARGIGPGERRGILWNDVGRRPGGSGDGVPDLSARDAGHARRGE